MTPQRDKRARIYLWGIAAMVFVAACTATGTYAYPSTFATIQEPLLLTHTISGDIAIGLSGLYLIDHLSRTWRMRNLKVSRYTGIGMVMAWCIASATGVYGHFRSLDDSPTLWNLHFVTSVMTVVGVCFHGLWAYRPRTQGAPA